MAAGADGGACRTGLVVDEAAFVDIELLTGEVNGTAENVFDLASVYEVNAAESNLRVVGGAEMRTASPPS